MLYKDGDFMQVLERDGEAVRGLYDRIAAGPRHGGEITLQQGFAEGRQFPDWSMGFCDLSSPEARADPGYTEFLNTPLTGREFSGEPSRARSSSSLSRGPCKQRETAPRASPEDRQRPVLSLKDKTSPKRAPKPSRLDLARVPSNATYIRPTPQYAVSPFMPL